MTVAKLKLWHALRVSVIALGVALTACDDAQHDVESGVVPAVNAQAAACEAPRQALARTFAAQLVRVVDECARCAGVVARDAGPIEGPIAEFPAGDSVAPVAIVADGRGLVYAVVDGRLLVRRLNAAGNPEPVSELALGLQTAEIFVDADGARIVLVGQREMARSAAAGPDAALREFDGARSPHASLILGVDVSAPAAPRIVNQFEIEGALIASARARERFHLVTRTAVQVPDAVSADPEVQRWVERYRATVPSGGDVGQTDAMDELVAAVRARLTPEIMAGITPVARRTGNAGSGNQTVLDCGNARVADTEAAASEWMVIATLDDDLAPVRTDASLGSGQQARATLNNVYIWQPRATTTELLRYSIDGRLSGFREAITLAGALRAAGDFAEAGDVLQVLTTAQDAAGGARAELTALALEQAGSGVRRISRLQFPSTGAVAAAAFHDGDLVVATGSGDAMLHLVKSPDPLYPALVASTATALNVRALQPLGRSGVLALGHASGASGGASLEAVTFEFSDAAGFSQTYRTAVSPSAFDSVCWETRGACAPVRYAAAGVVALPLLEFNAAGALEFAGISILDATQPGAGRELTRVATPPGAARLGDAPPFGVVEIGRQSVLFGVAGGELIAASVTSISAAF